MTDLLSVAADVLTLIGAALSLTLDVRRARAEARAKAGGTEAPGSDPGAAA
ncbi:hypothetical protein ACIPW5_26315 [Streptomyces sp. NPDC090077]|uniref:hypothetical protein n=1 Tax=Streptomyces sp. NPDC090077 TaxID=3365938 RepID=UPI0037F3256E